MTKQTEAMKLALEALEIATTPLAKDRQEVLRARTAIREALAEQPAQPQQEPVAWITQNGKGWLRWHKPEDNNTDSVPLYTSPPAQRKPLTDEELDAMFSKTLKGKKLVNWVARAIEAAHGIKENT